VFEAIVVLVSFWGSEANRGVCSLVVVMLGVLPLESGPAHQHGNNNKKKSKFIWLACSN
jgi:hypothetical protein